MKRQSAFICSLLFLLATVHAWSASAASGTPKMVIDQETYDVGDVDRSAEKIEHSFIIKNTGTAPLNILSATPG